MSSSKIWSVTGLGGRCLSEFIDWTQFQSFQYFRPSFVNCCTFNLLSGSTSPFPPLPCVNRYIVHKYTMCKGRGVRGSVGDHILQEFNTLYLTRFRTYKIATKPQTKTQEGWGPQTEKYMPQSPFTGQFFQMTTFCFVFYVVSSSMVRLNFNNLVFSGFLKGIFTGLFSLYTLDYLLLIKGLYVKKYTDLPHKDEITRFIA